MLKCCWIRLVAPKMCDDFSDTHPIMSFWHSKMWKIFRHLVSLPWCSRAILTIICIRTLIIQFRAATWYRYVTSDVHYSSLILCFLEGANADFPSTVVIYFNSHFCGRAGRSMSLTYWAMPPLVRVAFQYHLDNEVPALIVAQLVCVNWCCSVSRIFSDNFAGRFNCC